MGSIHLQQSTICISVRLALGQLALLLNFRDYSVILFAISAVEVYAIGIKDKVDHFV
jgi:hypothetical protein